MRIKNLFHMFFSALCIVIHPNSFFQSEQLQRAINVMNASNEMILTEFDRLFRQTFACPLTYNDSSMPSCFPLVDKVETI